MTAHMTAHMTSTKAQYNSTLNTVMCNRNAVQFLSRAVLYCSCMVHYQTMLWLCLHYRLCNIYILCVRIFISVGTQLQALAWLLIPRLVEDLPIAGNHFRKVNSAHTSEQLHWWHHTSLHLCSSCLTGSGVWHAGTAVISARGGPGDHSFSFPPSLSHHPSSPFPLSPSLSPSPPLPPAPRYCATTSLV